MNVRQTSCVARLDRVQILASPATHEKPTNLSGFDVMRDILVRCQTTIKTYARVRSYRSTSNGTQIFLQYARQAGWLPEWKVTIVGDDRYGLSRKEIEVVLLHCRAYRICLVELALDFSPRSAVTSTFVKRHARFGKSRRRAKGKKGRVLYFGGRKSDKLIRCYRKHGLEVFRVELELHSNLLRREHIATLNDFLGLPAVICPKHLQFVAVAWNRLRRHLKRKLGKRSDAVFTAARQRASSIRRVQRYLRRKGVSNAHRFLVPLAINKDVTGALNRWEREFKTKVRWANAK
jgi:hypothetical protein